MQLSHPHGWELGSARHGHRPCKGCSPPPPSPFVLCRAPGLPWDVLPTGDPSTRGGGSEQWAAARGSSLGWGSRCSGADGSPCVSGAGLSCIGPARSLVLAPAAPAWPPPVCPVLVSASAWLHSAFSAAPGTAGTSSPPLTDAPSDSSKQTLSNGRVWAPLCVAVTKPPSLPG